ncbi:hypothetical protein Taro_041164 [Colocasia esculenta]|uniref:Uncharacterized protein n=1 Tax=Colocasia esculenta TaxID=4460 RepID=A0A843WP12_COLES|nr:hypothetical protein [Colocasia esculenta]
MAASGVSGSVGGYGAEFLIAEQSATFSTCTKANSDMMFWAIQNQSINMVEVMIERMKFASAQVWDKKLSEKMGQAIRSRNLKKSGFSLVAGVWNKTSVAEGEAIIGEAQEVQREVAVAAEIPTGPGVQEQAAQEEAQVAAAAEVEPEILVDPVTEVVGSGHLADVVMEEAPIQGEQEIFREGIVESASDDANDDNVKLVARASSKGKEAAPGIPLLTRRPHQRQKKKKLKVNLKPLVARMDEQGKILCYVQSDIQSIFISQSTSAKEMGMVRNAVRWVRNPVRSAGPLGPVSKEQAGPSGPVSEEQAGPSGPISKEPTGPSGPLVVEEVATEMEVNVEVVKAGPPGPSEDVVGPSRPVVFEGVLPRVEEPAVASEAPDPSSLATPAPPSPPSSSTTPPAPITFKQPLPRTISSPTPFPSESSSSLATSTSIPPPPPVLKDPPASSSAGASSSSGPSSDGPSIIPPSTHQSFLHPPTPPSFITFIPEVLAVASHIHMTDSSSPWAKGHKALYNKFLLMKSEQFPPLKLIRYFQLFNDYRYLHKLPEVQLGQFQGAIASLKIENPVNCSFKVDLATLQIPDTVFFPKLHSLVMDSSVGPVIFERFACVIECERLSLTDWEKHYNQSALQLESLNSSLFKAGKPTLTAEAFLDLNSINLVQEPYDQWVERYKLFMALKKDLFVKEDLPRCSFPFVLKEDLVGSRVLYSSSGCEEKTSCSWVYAEEEATGRGQKDRAFFSEQIPVNLYLTYIDEDRPTTEPLVARAGVKRPTFSHLMVFEICERIFLFGPEPNGPPLKKVRKTVAGREQMPANTRKRSRGPAGAVEKRDRTSPNNAEKGVPISALGRELCVEAPVEGFGS